MFERVAIHASDVEASERFYDIVLPTLGLARGELAVVAGAPVTRGLHLGFAAPSHAHVDEFWRVGTAAGYRDDGAPGPRPQYREDYYGSFLLDPDGNSAEAAHHGALRRGGTVDHLWVRVADLSASRRRYEEEGLQVAWESPERIRFGGENGSFSLVLGTPTEGLDVTFARA